MSKGIEYRIVFYYDKRLKKDTYKIIPGSFTDANDFITWARKQDYLENVSEYFVVQDYKIMMGSNPRISAAYKDLEDRNIWEKSSPYIR